MISNLTCQHCGQAFEAEIVDKTEFCPHCGKETPVVLTPAKPPPSGLAPDNAKAIRDQARGVTLFAIFLMIAGLLLVLIGFIMLADSDHSASRKQQAVFCMSIGGGMAGASTWLYLLAQIIHIRANTVK